MPDIETVYGKTEKFLDSLTSDHEKRIAEAVAQLEKKMMNLYQTAFSEGKGKFELAQAQALHKSLVNEIDKKYSATIEGITKEYVGMKDRIESDLSEFNIPVSFTKADMEALEGLRQSTTGQFSALGAAAEQKIAQSLYTAVVAGTDFATLTDTMRDALDTNMKKYAGLYAHDGLHQYYQTLNVKAAEKAGVDTFLWAGNLRTGSRAKCVESANKVFSRAEIDEMEKEQWDGKHKNVSVWIAVGGYHCHHHLIPYIDDDAETPEQEEAYVLEKLSENPDSVDFDKIEKVISKGTPKKLQSVLKSLGAKNFESYEDYNKFLLSLNVDELQKARDILISSLGKNLTPAEIRQMDYKNTWLSKTARYLQYKTEVEPLAIAESEKIRNKIIAEMITGDIDEKNFNLVKDGLIHLNTETLTVLKEKGYEIRIKNEIIKQNAAGVYFPNSGRSYITKGRLYKDFSGKEQQSLYDDFYIRNIVSHETAHAYDSLLTRTQTDKYLMVSKETMGYWVNPIVTEKEASDYRDFFKKQLTGKTYKKDGEEYYRGDFLDAYEGRKYSEDSIGEEFFSRNTERYSDYLYLKKTKKATERLNLILERAYYSKDIDTAFPRKKASAIKKALKLKNETEKNDALAMILSDWGEAKKAYPEFTDFLEDLYSRKP